MAKRQRKKNVKAPGKEARGSEQARTTNKETIKYKRQQTPKPLNLKRTSSFLYIAKPKRAQDTVESLWKKARKARNDRTISSPVEDGDENGNAMIVEDHDQGDKGGDPNDIGAHVRDLRPSVEVHERLLDSSDVDQERLIRIDSERSEQFSCPSQQPPRVEREVRGERERDGLSSVSIQNKDASSFSRVPPQVSHSSQEEFAHENEEALSVSPLIPLDPEIGIGSRKKRQPMIQLPSFLTSSSPRSRLV